MTSSSLLENQLAWDVWQASLQIHKALGPGLLESAYEECLYYELAQMGLKVDHQKGLPLIYKEVKMAVGYWADLLVEDKLIVEIKAKKALAPVDMAQVITYLKLSGCKLGLLINFNVALIKDGFKRVVLGL